MKSTLKNLGAGCDFLSIERNDKGNRNTHPALLPSLPLSAALLEAEVVVAGSVRGSVFLWPALPMSSFVYMGIIISGGPGRRWFCTFYGLSPGHDCSNSKKEGKGELLVELRAFMCVDIGSSQVLINKIQEFTHQYKQLKNEVTNQQTLLL